MEGIITIITDFGNMDHYTGVMKGVMLGIHRYLRFIDISNDVPSFSISSAAFMLYASWNYFPDGTIFLTVIDPGVGSERGIILGSDTKRIVVSPDNGIVSLLTRFNNKIRFYIPSNSVMEEIESIFHERSSTFHGRDIFAPLAAIIAKNGFDYAAGNYINPITIPEIKKPRTIGRKIMGTVIHIDKFGNCITSIHRDDMENSMHISGQNKTANKEVYIEIGNLKIDGITEYFSQVSEKGILAYLGSSHFLEIAINKGNAARDLGIKIGDRVFFYPKGKT